jgi:Ca-activated chloride channel family protein
LSAVKRFAEEHDVLIYAVGIGITNRAEWHLPGLSPEARLKSLAEMAGGKAFFPDSIKELPDVCARINVDLRNQYILGYRSMNTARDGKWRKIRVSINKNPDQKPLHVRAKKLLRGGLQGFAP